MNCCTGEKHGFNGEWDEINWSISFPVLPRVFPLWIGKNAVNTVGVIIINRFIVIYFNKYVFVSPKLHLDFSSLP